MSRAVPPFPLRQSVIVLALAMLPLVAIVVSSLWTGIDIPRFTRDPLASLHVHPLTGVISELGVLMWWSGASVWGFSALVLQLQGEAQEARMLVHAALLSAYLAIDDQFQIHEDLAERYLGVPEMLVYAVLALAVAAFLLHHRRRLLRVDGWLLFISLAALGSSALLDAVLESRLWRLGHWYFLLEDGSKWIGIVFWTVFAIVRSQHELRHHLPRRA